MKCHEARKWMSPYLDSELGQTKTYEVSEHLQQCEACAERFEGEGRVDEMIRDRIEQECMPDELWGSLREIPDRLQRTLWHAWGSRLAMAAVLVFTFVGVMRLWPDREGPSTPQIVSTFVSSAPDNQPFSTVGDRTVLARQVNARLRRDFGIEVPIPTPEQLGPHVNFEILSATVRTDAAGREWVEVRLNCCGQPLLLAFAKGDGGTLPDIFSDLDVGAPDATQNFDGVHVASRELGGGTAVVVSKHPVAGVIRHLRVVGA